MCVGLCGCMYVCVCVCVREREREKSERNILLSYMEKHVYSILANNTEEINKVKSIPETHMKHRTKNETYMRGRTLDAQP